MALQERIVGPLHGFYLACYTAVHDGSHYGYAKVCAGPPGDVWEASYAIRKLTIGPFRTSDQAMNAIVRHGGRQIADRSTSRVVRLVRLVIGR